jgi:hypothetical protein
VWFTDLGSTKAIGRITPTGTITEFSTGLNAGSNPWDIAAGADGNLWFTDNGETAAIGQIGVGIQAASIAAPSVIGSGQQGTQQTCQGALWSEWASQQPLLDEYEFDGYQWLLAGAAITGANSQYYTPVAGDVGHQLTCTVTVTYALLQTTASATSTAITVIPQASGMTGSTGAAGAAGAAGARGATGPHGPAGELELVSCKAVTTTVTRKHHNVRVTKQVCTTKLVSGSFKFTDESADERASLSRDGAVYARGYARRTRGGVRTSLLAARQLPSGRYTLMLTNSHGSQRTASRQQVRIR